MRCPDCGMKECCGAYMAPEIERLEAKIAELERQNKLLLDDVQGIAEANIPACDAAEFAYSMRRECKETLKALTLTPE